MKNGLTISVMAHAAVLLWAVVSFAPRTLNAPPAESMPIDIISTTEFSQLRAGARNTPKTQTPKPLVEKVAEKKAADDPIAKIVQKPELITASAQVPPPAADAKPEPKSKAAENKDPKPDPKSDAIADVLKKEQKPDGAARQARSAARRGGRRRRQSHAGVRRENRRCAHPVAERDRCFPAKAQVLLDSARGGSQCGPDQGPDHHPLEAG